MNTNRQQISNWLDWFDSRDSFEAINKACLEKLFTTFKAGISKSDCIQAILNHKETAYLFKDNFGTSRVSIFHHLLSAGGTVYDPSTKVFGFIQGIGKSTSTFVTPDIDTLCGIQSDTASHLPSIINLFSVASTENINDLVVSNRNSYVPRNFIPVPPFLLSPIYDAISKSDGNAAEVLLSCIKEIKNFDNSHTNDNEYTEKAKTKCKEIVFWLYLVSQDSTAIKATPTTGCYNEKVATSLLSITNICLTQNTIDHNIITQVENSLKRPFEVLAASSSSTSDIMEKFTQLQSQNIEKSVKSFKKIPTKYQNMILVASSDCEVTEVDYNAEGEEFFKCSNCLNAQIMLNSILEADSIECSVSAAVTTALLYGSFLWKNALSPSGFAASLISSENSVFCSDTLHEGMILDYSTKFEISKALLEKLTSSQVLFPVDLEELIHRVRAIHALACFFFKKTSLLSQGLKKVVNFCLDNKNILKTRIYLDEDFIPKLLCAIDERIYHWLKQCSLKSSVLDTDISLIEFSSLLSDILLNRFLYMLPPSIAKISSAKKDTFDNTKPNNRKKETPILVRNTNVVNDWRLRPNETWNTVFREKSNDGPVLSMQCKPCLKYHVKGVCFEDCRHKNSHCTLKGNDKVKMDNFIKSLRGE